MSNPEGAGPLSYVILETLATKSGGVEANVLVAWKQLTGAAGLVQATLVTARSGSANARTLLKHDCRLHQKDIGIDFNHTHGLTA